MAFRRVDEGRITRSVAVMPAATGFAGKGCARMSGAGQGGFVPREAQALMER